jgi:hypothetical protein
MKVGGILRQALGAVAALPMWLAGCPHPGAASPQPSLAPAHLVAGEAGGQPSRLQLLLLHLVSQDILHLRTAAFSALGRELS